METFFSKLAPHGLGAALSAIILLAIDLTLYRSGPLVEKGSSLTSLSELNKSIASDGRASEARLPAKNQLVMKSNASSFALVKKDARGLSQISATRALDKGSDIRLAYTLKDVCKIVDDDPALAGHIKGELAAVSEDGQGSPIATLVNVQQGSICDRLKSGASPEVLLLVSGMSQRRLSNISNINSDYVAVSERRTDLPIKGVMPTVTKW